MTQRPQGTKNGCRSGRITAYSEATLTWIAAPLRGAGLNGAENPGFHPGLFSVVPGRKDGVFLKR